LRSFPSRGIVIFLSKGLEVATTKRRKPRLRMPIIAKKLTLKRLCRLLLYTLARNIQKLETTHHKSIDPSCPAHAADILYMSGRLEFEFLDT
jgi:hypothetical protein